MNFIFPDIENFMIPTKSYFSEGYHQPVLFELGRELPSTGWDPGCSGWAVSKLDLTNEFPDFWQTMEDAVIGGCAAKGRRSAHVAVQEIPAGDVKIAMENGHQKSEFSHENM